MAVVLALLTNPPMILIAENPRFPRYRWAKVPDAESTTKIAANSTTCGSDTGEESRKRGVGVTRSDLDSVDREERS